MSELEDGMHGMKISIEHIFILNIYGFCVVNYDKAWGNIHILLYACGYGPSGIMLFAKLRRNTIPTLDEPALS